MDMPREPKRWYFRPAFFAGFVAGTIFGPVALIGAYYTVYYIALSRYPNRIEPPVLPITDADFEWELETFAGEPFPFSRLKGKAIFMTVWNPGCDICVSELPFLEELYRKANDESIAFAMVSISDDDSILDLVAEYDLTFPIYIQKKERPAMYRTGAVPSTFVISPEGKLVFRHRGPARWDDDSFVTYLHGVALGGMGETEDRPAAGS